jgi:hypothetical protein
MSALHGPARLQGGRIRPVTTAWPHGVPIPMKLFAHPFSSYCQKVLTALYENDTPFEW